MDIDLTKTLTLMSAILVGKVYEVGEIHPFDGRLLKHLGQLKFI